MKTRFISIKILSLLVFFLISMLLVSPMVSAGDLVSKKYKFKAGTKLELDAIISDIAINSIEFRLPGAAKGKHFAITGKFKADVEIENKSKENAKVGIAIALYDSAGNLVGVGTGGSKMFFKIKSGDKKEYTVPFYYVTENIEDASKFQITLELR